MQHAHACGDMRRMNATFFTPESLSHASQLLRENPNAIPIAGGTDILVQMNVDRIAPEGFVNIWPLLNRKITKTDDGIILGAGVSAAQIAKSALIKKWHLPLWEAARTMGSPQVLNRATLGGNLGNASPAADMIPAMMVDDARVTLQNGDKERTLGLHTVFTGPGRTVLKKGELAKEFFLPRPAKNSYCRFDRLGYRQAQVIAILNFSIRAIIHNGAVEDIRITWGSVAPKPVRSPAIEGILKGTSLNEHTIELAIEALTSDISPIDDHRGSRAYRLSVARSYLRRALKELQQCL